MIQLAVIGAGRFGSLHIEILQTIAEVNVLAVVEPDPQRLKEVQEKYHIPHGFSSVEELWQLEVDAVDITSNEDTHGAIILEALHHNKKVFVEKPLATSREEINKIRKTARAGQIMTGHISRFSQEQISIKKALEEGVLGKLSQIRAIRDFNRSWFQGFGHRVHPVFESGIHDLDLIIWYADAQWKTVYAMESHAVGETSPDSFQALIEFENGLQAVIMSSWMLPEGAPPTLNELGTLDLQGTIKEYIELIGTKGTAKYQQPNAGFQVWTEKEAGEPDTRLWPPGIHGPGGALKRELEYFCECLLQNKNFDWMPLEQACASFYLAEAIIASGKTKQIITREETNDS
ncbi:Gfo/Idh/MocA family protein [Alkalicoccus daliensis]|uniref:Predicted dehydrogenase n=1 Tax=Alkalicoccus daliensis TaxID=745820 RepID=A0A1H0GDY7_9BACI|nr:Gfo/Idh/MocA family oxidoreductase [Alkalicoccus daliensis]SDO05074.1 Predicted dehydrogenase [Alkalicoccus daliensis]